MAFFNEADIKTMFADFGVDITLGANTVEKGALLDTPDELFFERELTALIGQATRVIVQTGVLPGLSVESEITVDGTDYKVSTMLRLGDGAITELLCAKA